MLIKVEFSLQIFEKYSVQFGRKPGNGTLKYTALRESLLKTHVNK
jgi:hypothetical protein